MCFARGEAALARRSRDRQSPACRCIRVRRRAATDLVVAHKPELSTTARRPTTGALLHVVGRGERVAAQHRGSSHRSKFGGAQVLTLMERGGDAEQSLTAARRAIAGDRSKVDQRTIRVPPPDHVLVSGRVGQAQQVTGVADPVDGDVQIEVAERRRSPACTSTVASLAAAASVAVSGNTLSEPVADPVTVIVPRSLARMRRLSSHRYRTAIDDPAADSAIRRASPRFAQVTDTESLTGSIHAVAPYPVEAHEHVELVHLERLRSVLALRVGAIIPDQPPRNVDHTPTLTRTFQVEVARLVPEQ